MNQDLTFWHRFLAAIIRDRSNALTFFISVTLALAGYFSTLFLGVDLKPEHAGMVTFGVTCMFGWIISALGGNENAKGSEKLQRRLQSRIPELEVDGHIGEKTIAAAEQVVHEAILKKR